MHVVNVFKEVYSESKALVIVYLAIRVMSYVTLIGGIVNGALPLIGIAICLKIVGIVVGLPIWERVTAE